jgi:hypothetical protein
MNPGGLAGALEMPGSESNCYMAGERAPKTHTELERERNELLQQQNEAGKRFLFIDADLALTFCQIARRSKNKAKATESLKRAEASFNIIWNTRSLIAFSAEEITRLNQSLAALHDALTECLGLNLAKPDTD